MPDDARPLVILGHGASGTAESMRPYVDGLGRRGVEARAIDLPRTKAERAVPVFRAAIDEAVAAGRHVVAGGHSYGGRVASLAVSEGTPGVVALLLFSYPLHRPGSGEWEARSAHFRAIGVPALLLVGEADPFVRMDLLAAAMPLLRRGRLVTYPRTGHGLRGRLDAALDEAAAFVCSLVQSRDE